MKKIIAFALSIFLIFTLFGCKSEPSADVSDETVKLWWAHSTENLLQDMSYDYDRDSTLRFYAIRGETEAMQLMITPKEDVKSFSFEAGSLKSDNGAQIAPENFEILGAKYLEVLGTYNALADVGYFPDALVPMNSLVRARENSIAAGNNQSVWLNLDIPADAPAGLYKGYGTLNLDKKEYKIPIEVKVYDGDMPEEVHAKTAFAVWYDYIDDGEGEYSTQLADSYFWFLIDHRIMTTNVEPVKYANFDLYLDFMVENLAQNPKVSCYNIPYRVIKDEHSHNILDENSVRQMLSMMIDENIRLREAGDTETDLFRKGYYYLGNICDEPHGEVAFTRTRKCDLIISTVKLELAPRLAAYPDLQDSLLSIQHVVTTEHIPELEGTDTVGGVQTWCPTFDNVYSESSRELYAQRKNNPERMRGEGLWWYGCIYPRAPFPTYHLNDSLVSARVLNWMQFDYEVEGNLYWAVNYYGKSGGTSRDVWTDAYVFKDVVGEGQLVYPGAAYDLNTPISTCRLETVREGNEDYEYFWLIDEAVKRYNEEKGTQLKTQDLLRDLLDGLYKGTIPERDAQLLHERRLLLLQLVEDINLNETEAVENLCR